MAEVQSIVGKLDEKQELKDYLKKFTFLSKDKSLRLIEEIKSLNNIKIKDENAVKISDFLPRTQEEVRKIFIETSLTDEETNAILNIVGKY